MLVLAAALICLRLGWWQWGVAHATRGTVQNLGYALLWPVFAGAFIYMWLRFLHLESVRDAELAQQDGDGSAGDDARPDADTAMPGGADARGAPATVGGPGAGGEGGDGAADAQAGTQLRDEDAAGERDESQAEDAKPDRTDTRHRRPHESYTIAVATVGADDDDDPELAAYNRALAELAEQDRRRAR